MSRGQAVVKGHCEDTDFVNPECLYTLQGDHRMIMCAGNIQQWVGTLPGASEVWAILCPRTTMLVKVRHL
jgi:hypothetical protein